MCGVCVCVLELHAVRTLPGIPVLLRDRGGLGLSQCCRSGWLLPCVASPLGLSSSCTQLMLYSVLELTHARKHTHAHR